MKRTFDSPILGEFEIVEIPQDISTTSARVAEFVESMGEDEVLLNALLAQKQEIHTVEDDVFSNSKSVLLTMVLVEETFYFDEVNSRIQTPQSATLRLANAVYRTISRYGYAILSAHLVGCVVLQRLIKGVSTSSGLILIGSLEDYSRDKSHYLDTVKDGPVSGLKVHAQGELARELERVEPVVGDQDTANTTSAITEANSEFQKVVKDLAPGASTSNTDHRIFAYFSEGVNRNLKSYTNTEAYAWCGIFQAFIHRKMIPLHVRIKLASCTRAHSIIDDVVGENPLRQQLPLEPGCIVTVGSRGKYGDHMVLVIGVDKRQGVFTTIEGNGIGKLGDGSKGEGVVTRTRKIADINSIYHVHRVRQWR